VDRIEGRVKWFSNSKGYGFIIPDEKTGMTDDIFVHYSQLDGKGFKTLRDGERVEFKPEKTQKGYHAQEVVVLEEV
jgi:CspA family cold shock protein